MLRHLRKKMLFALEREERIQEVKDDEKVLEVEIACGWDVILSMGTRELGLFLKM